jgi:hypothetical protein
MEISLVSSPLMQEISEKNWTIGDNNDWLETTTLSGPLFNDDAWLGLVMLSSLIESEDVK